MIWVDFVVESEESAVESEPDDDEDEKVTSNRVKKKSSPTEGKSPQGLLKVRSTNLGARFVATSSYVSTASAKPTQSQRPIRNRLKGKTKERYQWLVNIKDAEKSSPDDPNYDPRTLYIPSSAGQSLLLFEKQYWEIKGKMWDTVVFL